MSDNMACQKVAGNFDHALGDLIFKVQEGRLGNNPPEVKEFCRKLLADWDVARGNDWYTTTRRRGEIK